jgi:mannose-1-phosphate guanylyltransferase
MINIILCGGSGTRLWPISRTLMPKQFVRLFNKQSLFQLTVSRNSSLCHSQFVVSNADQFFLAQDQLEELKRTQNKFLLEPVGRNTAPAIALACLLSDPEQVVLVSPSDHLIKEQTAYLQALSKAQALAEQNYLVTFGITPTAPETGYGYIQANGEDVVQFCEKPDLATAQSYLEQGNFYWNSGMFCFKAGVFLEELKAFAPEMLSACEHALQNAPECNGVGLTRIHHEDMAAIPANSIDYAVMEKSKRVKVIPSDIGWCDLGSFESLHGELPVDADGNTVVEDFIGVNSHNNLIMSRDRLIAAIDMDDHIIVDTSDALLIAPRSSSQKVKQVVDELKNRGSDLHHLHVTVNRPWGTYTILRESEGYKVKRITVHKGKRLSLQLHHHRSEHWVVLKGTAKVTVGDQEFLLRPNESTYIPAGEKHRLENPGCIELEIVEVQVGNYVGEDDIVRFKDDWEREVF